MKQKPHRKLWKIAAWIVIGLIISCILAAAGLWMAFQRVPSWYKPVQVSEADLPRIRNSVPNTYDELNRKIHERATFEFSIDGRTLTEWVVARDEIYPDARDWVPPWIQDPVVSFQDGHGIVSARISHDGVQAIVGVHFVADIRPDEITVRIDQLTAGAVPVPMDWLMDIMQDYIDYDRLDVDLMPDPLANLFRKLQSSSPEEILRKGLTWPNRFQLENSRRSVTILSATAEDNKLSVKIDPT